MLEDGAYRRLLDIYYAREAPLPKDPREVCRLARAVTKQERDATQRVLREFFIEQEDGWHQRRCDEEIERYRHSEPEREARKANEAARNRRHREERAALFEALRAVGQHPDWNAPIGEVRALHKRYCTGPATPPATPPETLQVPLQATASATPATATHSHFPLPTSQYPIDTSPQASHVSASPSRARACEAPKPIGDHGPFERLKAAYPPGIYPQSDWLLAEREAERRAEEGETWEALIAGAERYAHQCEALGRLRTQFVTKPSRFFGAELRHYREAWPLPSESTTPQPKRRKPSPTTAELEAAAAQERAHAAG